MKRFICKRIISMVTAFVVIISVVSISAFAADGSQIAKTSNNSVVTTNMKVGDKVVKNLVDPQGNPATLTVERIATPNTNGNQILTASSSNSWKASYDSVLIHCCFYVTVTDNVITNAYGEWIRIIGGYYANDSLNYWPSYAILRFETIVFNGMSGSLDWLQATVTGSGNNVTLSCQM